MLTMSFILPITSYTQDRWGLLGILSGYEHWLFFLRSRVWFSVTTWQLRTSNFFSSRGSDFFWSLQEIGIHMVHRHTCRKNTYTYKIKKMKNLKNKWTLIQIYWGEWIVWPVTWEARSQVTYSSIHIESHTVPIESHAVTYSGCLQKSLLGRDEALLGEQLDMRARQRSGTTRTL